MKFSKENVLKLLYFMEKHIPAECTDKKTYLTDCMQEQRIDFYFKNGNNNKPESVVECIVERICNIMQG